VPFLGARGHRELQHARQRGSVLRIAEVWRYHDEVGEVEPSEVGREFAQRVQVVHRNREEAMHLRRVQRHRQHPIGARGGEQVGHEPTADGDSRHGLLIRPRVGVVRYDGRDPGRRRTACRVQHQQQLDQVLLDGRAKRLDDEDISLAAIREQLHFQTVVGEPGQPHRMQRYVQVRADFRRQGRVRAAAEDHDLSHVPRLVGGSRAAGSDT
jgi:hypothetical protein